MTRDQLITALIAREGGYVANPADRGGPTCYGITQAVARAHGYAGDMRAMPLDVARQIYATDYWSGPHFDRVADLAPGVSGELFDTGVNMGVLTAGKFLQRALNVLTGDGLMVDGAIADKSVSSLRRYLATRAAQSGEAVLIELLNCFQGERYAEIVERDGSQRAFVFGQVRNRVMDRSPSA